MERDVCMYIYGVQYKSMTDTTDSEREYKIQNTKYKISRPSWLYWSMEKEWKNRSSKWSEKKEDPNEKWEETTSYGEIAHYVNPWILPFGFRGIQLFLFCVSRKSNIFVSAFVCVPSLIGLSSRQNFVKSKQNLYTC